MKENMINKLNGIKCWKNFWWWIAVIFSLFVIVVSWISICLNIHQLDKAIGYLIGGEIVSFCFYILNCIWDILRRK